jgi:hypothetical protein
LPAGKSRVMVTERQKEQFFQVEGATVLGRLAPHP